MCDAARELCGAFDDDESILYCRLYHCSAPAAQPFLLLCLTIWLLVLFASMATAAGDFMCIHLKMIVSILDISESLAGVTIFAFGNGSTDLFSTIAAMGRNRGSLAISELYGAAAFITTVVLGLIAIVQPFLVESRSFVGETVWFIVAASLLTLFLADGKLALEECLAIIGLYLVFVLYSVIGSRKPQTSVEVQAVAEVVDGPVADADETTSLLAHEHSSSSEDIDRNPHSAGSRVRANDRFSLRGILLSMFPPLMDWNERNKGEKVLTALSLPLLILIGLTTPSKDRFIDDSSTSPTKTTSQRDDGSSDHTTTSRDVLHDKNEKEGFAWTMDMILWLQLGLGPQLFAAVLSSAMSSDRLLIKEAYIGQISALVFSTILIASIIICRQSHHDRATEIVNLVCAAFGFAMSLLWIYLTATSAVSVLEILAFILHIPDVILGFTIFAIGNSSNDLVADVAVARKGSPVLAASACFGGPMMNMLLGIGIGGLTQVLSDGSLGSHGVRKPFSFDISASFFVSAANLITGLVVSLGYGYLRSWRLDRTFGFILIGVWLGFTALNLGLSVKWK